MPTLEEIYQSVAEQTGIGIELLRGEHKTNNKNITRGVFYVIAKEYGYHPREASRYVSRSRMSCIIITKRFEWLIDHNDREIVNIYMKTKKKLIQYENL